VLNLKVVVGSARQGRAADRVVPWIEAQIAGYPAFDAEVLDLRHWPLPFFAENVHTIGDIRDPRYSDPIVKQWNERVAEGDVFLFITPEYNHSIPAVLKNAIDTVFASFAFRNKAAAFVGYSGGIAAGARAIEHLAQIAIEAEMVPLRNTVLIPFVGNAFDEHGRPIDSNTEAALSIVLDDLQWWGGALQSARRLNQLPPAMFRKSTTTGKSQ